jgi:hypothetical protein
MILRTLLPLGLSAALAAQNPCPDGGIGSIVTRLDLDAATGNDAHLGVTVVGGEYFVSARGPGAIPPHKVYVLDAAGNLLRSLDQPSGTAASPWGMRDLATDGLNLFGGDETGIHGLSPQGAAVTQVRAANGARPLGALNNSPADQILGVFRALAFDPQGDGGEGSFWSANFGSDLVEFDLGGSVLRRFSNQGGWSIYGLALDPCSGSLWAYSSPSDGDIVEISSQTGLPTGRRIRAAGVQGGLEIFAAPDGRRTLFARLEQTGPDVLHVGVLHRVPGVCDGLELLSEVDGGGLDRSFKQVGIGAGTLTVVTAGTPRNAPTAYLMNFGPDAMVCGDVSWLGPSWAALEDLVVAFGISQPPGAAIGLSAVSGQALSFAAGVFPSLAAEPLRIQAVWLDPRVPGAYLPVLATNEVEFLVDRRPPLGVVVEAVGDNSFNQITGSGFFSVRNPTATAIRAISLEAVGGMVFDFAQVGMGDRFDGGNSAASGCAGTFRNGSDLAAGLDYASNPISPCDPGARQAHRETGSTGPRVTLPFAGGNFRNGVRLEWDLDTDGGAGVTGASMAGMGVTVEFADGDRRRGVLAADPSGARRAFVVL